ncbi:hypothetical protein BJ165DRAFT_636052 [Panaeolus papilionaceus]|nr:hypothetical protein BJ165DRAFT_636052 [Panaeolus papilionaceus]
MYISFSSCSHYIVCTIPHHQNCIVFDTPVILQSYLVTTIVGFRSQSNRRGIGFIPVNPTRLLYLSLLSSVALVDVFFGSICPSFVHHVFPLLSITVANVNSLPSSQSPSPNHSSLDPTTLHHHHHHHPHPSIHCLIFFFGSVPIRNPTVERSSAHHTIHADIIIRANSP